MTRFELGDALEARERRRDVLEGQIVVDGRIIRISLVFRLSEDGLELGGKHENIFV